VSQLYSVSLEGGEPERVLEGSRGKENPVYSPDGKFLAYDSGEGQLDGRIHLHQIDGSGSRVLNDGNETPLNPIRQRMAAWSPDGSKIAYIFNFGGGPYTLEVWVTSVDQPHSYPVAKLGRVNSPVWCGYGKTIFFRRTGKLWKVSSDGSLPPAEVAVGPSNPSPTSCTRNGEKLLFHGREDGGTHLYLLPVEGGESEKVSLPVKNAYSGSYSPNGEKLAFLSRSNGEVGLYVWDFVSEKAQRLTHSQFSISVPRWAADGNSLVFSRTDGFNTLRLVKVPEGLPGESNPGS
jgi:Tol biopolymer transport system component